MDSRTMMDIYKLRELNERRRAIDEQLQNMTAPRMTDTEQIRTIYTLFADYCDGTRVEVHSKQSRRLFVAVAVALYSPITLVGGRMAKGLRDAVARLLEYQTPEAVSMVVRSVVSEYSVYAKFRDEVDVVCSFVEERLTANVK